MSRLLVTGATGTVGSELVPALLEAGHDVRCLSRDPDGLADRAWRDRVEVACGDAKERADLVAAMDGCGTAYYLIHGLSGGDEATLVEDETAVARTFLAAAEEAGVDRIVYLGGLVDEDDVEDLSPHMRSRFEVGRTLDGGAAELVELRASLVLGRTSDSFRLLETVATSVPALPRTAWTMTRTQPIAIADVTRYLVAALELAPGTYDVGGPDVVTFLELVQAYRSAAGMERLPEVEAPMLPRMAASPVLALLSDVDPLLTSSLLASAEHDSVVAASRAIGDVVDHVPLTVEDALARAIEA